GFAVAVARVDERRTAGRRSRLRRKALPHCQRAQPFVQEYQRRGMGAGARRPDPLVFEAVSAGGEEGNAHRRRLYLLFIARSLKRWILPVAVFGSSGMNSIQRGYLNGARRSFTCCLSASARAGVPATPGLVTT